MKSKLILPIIMLLGVVGCGNNSSTNTTNISSNNVNIILDVPDADKVTPNQGEWVFTDYNDSPSDYNTDKWYANELKSIPLPDPYVIEEDGVYYIYGTTDRTGSRTFDCYSTTDFNHFTLYKDIYKRDSGVWSGTTSGMFAPEVMKFDDTYYLYYSAELLQHGVPGGIVGMRYIDVLVSDSPTGPFTEYKGTDYYGNELDGYKAPLFRYNEKIRWSVLDQTMFVDDDGKMYMYYSVFDDAGYDGSGYTQYIVGFEMLDPVTPDWDTYKILIRPGEFSPDDRNMKKPIIWEAYTSAEVAEGPQMIKSPNGKYYMTYSVNHYPNKYYTVCYAVSDSPLGDFEKPYEEGQMWTNLLFGYAGLMAGSTVFNQWNDFMGGTAHHCFFKIGDQHMIGYHAHKNRKNSDNGRMFGMDKLFFDEEGVPYCLGPTATLQTLPEAISGYKNIALDARVYASPTIIHAERINDNYISEHYNLSQEADTEVSFPSTKCYIELEFDKEYEIGGIQVMNSAHYDKRLERIEYINFFNDNSMHDLYADYNHIKDETEFIFPTSGFTYDIEGIRANKVVIAFDYGMEFNLNEIIVLGK